jgi:hypothetical protein
MKKVLIAVRHGRKTSTDRISVFGLQEVMKLSQTVLTELVPELVEQYSPGNKNISLCHGVLIRTIETLAALRLGCPMLGDNIQHPYIEFGDDLLFAEMKKLGFLDVVVNSGIAIAAATENGKRYGQTALDGVCRALINSPTAVNLMVGHYPMIPLAAIACGYKFFDNKFPELSIIVFEMDDDETITVLRTIIR